MFDFAWTEIALIGVVALVAIGPKDLPVAIKTIAQMIKKARRMAGEFQGHFDEMVREANLGDVRNQINELRNFDVKGAIGKAIDSDGSLRSGFDNPMTPSWTAPAPNTAPNGPADSAADTFIASTEDHVITAPEETVSAEAEAAPGLAADMAEADATAAPVIDPPIFIPPAFIPPAIAKRAQAPAFIPPSAARS
jgi:sec-independent protein translocase protein TatB